MANIDKELRQMQKNAENYTERLAELRAEMERRGLDKYWVSGRTFDFDSLTQSDSIFKVGAKGPQKIAMPFTDKQFEKFREIPKKRIGAPFILTNKGKTITGTYLMGKDAGRPVIYALSIVRNSNEKYAYTDFNIKLDMLVAGKEWLPLVRFDGLDNEHPNYIVNGKVAQSQDRVQKISGPHIHLNNETTQVLTTDLSYTTARRAPAPIISKAKNKNQSFFKSSLDYVLSECGMSSEILASNNPEYLFDFKQNLFEY